jgi:DNA polymerase-3 subunit gamma/tau
MAPMRGPTMQAAAPALAQGAMPLIASFPQLVEMIRDKRDMKLLMEVETGIRLVHFAPGRVEFEPAPGAAADLAARLSQRLQGWTGQRWGVSVVGSGGQPTLAEERAREQDEARAEAMQNPLVKAALLNFPGARITEIRTPEQMMAEAAAEALPEVEDEWDPFEDG